MQWNTMEPPKSDIFEETSNDMRKCLEYNVK